MDVNTQQDPISATNTLGRRLQDKILIAFKHACDCREFDVASKLLHTIERLDNREFDKMPLGERRMSVESLVEAYEHLWELKNQTKYS